MPVFPIFWRRRSLTALVNFTTIDRQLQNAYSRQASLEIERHVAPSARSASGISTSGAKLLIQINQNVPHAWPQAQTTVPPESELLRTTTATRRRRIELSRLHVSFVQRPARWGITVSVHYRNR
jgi:hypothetical protein